MHRETRQQVRRWPPGTLSRHARLLYTSEPTWCRGGCHGLRCSWGENQAAGPQMEGKGGGGTRWGWRWWFDELSRRRWDLRRRRRTHPLRLAAHLASWGRRLGFGDWEFGGDFGVDLSLIWRERVRFESREDRFGGRGGRFGGREGRFGAQWKGECREEHGSAAATSSPETGWERAFSPRER